VVTIVVVKRLSACLASATLAALIVPLPGRAAAACPHAAAAGKGWTAIDPTSAYPSSDPSSSTTAYAVDARRPSTILATNGTTIVRSTNGGCTWRVVFSVHPVPPDPTRVAGDKIVSLWSSGRAYATIIDANAAPFAPSIPTEVAVSTNAGSTWRILAPDPSMSDCYSTQLAPYPATPSKVYLACTYYSPSQAEALFQSTNGGTSWRRVNAPDFGGNFAFGMTRLVIDPGKASSLWVPMNQVCQANGGCTWGVSVQSSPNGGKAWAQRYADVDLGGVAQNGGTIGLDVAHPAGGPLLVAAWGPAGIVETRNAGRSWASLKVPTPPSQIGPIWGVTYAHDGATAGVWSSYGTTTCARHHRFQLTDASRRHWRSAPRLQVPAGEVVQSIESLSSAGNSFFALAALGTLNASPMDVGGKERCPPTERSLIYRYTPGG
jgi:hypothetical protein